MKAAWCGESREPGFQSATRRVVPPLRAAVFLTSRQANDSYLVIPWASLFCHLLLSFLPCRIVLVKFTSIGYQNPAGAIKGTFTDHMLTIHTETEQELKPTCIKQGFCFVF